MKHLFTKKFNNLKVLVLLMLGLGGRLPVAAQATCGSIDPAGNASQPGLYAEYYAGYWYGSASTDADRGAFFTTKAPALRKVETALAVNFANSAAWGDLYNSGAGPAGGTATNPDNFSARYRGGITVPTAGTYTFYLTTDDASYLWLDGDAKLQNPALANATIKVNGVGTEVASAALPLTAGFHNLAIMYGENGGDNYLVLKYTGPGTTARTVVPSSWFCTGIRSVPTTLVYSPATQQASPTASTSSVAPVR